MGPKYREFQFLFTSFLSLFLHDVSLTRIQLIHSQKFGRYFMIAKKGIKLDGSTPTLLYGYGGFEISLGPRYATTVGVSWLERGGVYVEANIRGGGEYGPKWHQVSRRVASLKCKMCHLVSYIVTSCVLFVQNSVFQSALKENRNKCYEDFIAVGEV